jgi:hypothetical protein
MSCKFHNFFKLKKEASQVWWHVPAIPAFGRLRQDGEIKGILGYTASPISRGKKSVVHDLFKDTTKNK